MDMEKLFDDTVIKRGYDPLYLRYLLAWHNVIMSTKETTPEHRSASYKRKKKRNIQKLYGDDWKAAWEETKAALKSLDKMNFQKGLLSYLPTPLNAAHRPSKDNLWHAIHDMREYTSYIKEKTGKNSRPDMKIIEEFLIAEKQWNNNPASGTRLQSEWDKRKIKILKQRMKQHYPPLERLRGFYDKHREKIELALETGIPFYELPKGSKGSK